VKFSNDFLESGILALALMLSIPRKPWGKVIKFAGIKPE